MKIPSLNNKKYFYSKYKKLSEQQLKDKKTQIEKLFSKLFPYLKGSIVSYGATLGLSLGHPHYTKPINENFPNSNATKNIVWAIELINEVSKIPFGISTLVCFGLHKKIKQIDKAIDNSPKN